MNFGFTKTEDRELAGAKNVDDPAYVIGWGTAVQFLPGARSANASGKIHFHRRYAIRLDSIAAPSGQS